MIHLPTWLQRHSLEIAPATVFDYDGFTVLEAEIAIISRACPKRIRLLEGEDIHNKSENHKVLMYGMLLDVQELASFCASARQWLNLPIKELGNTRFSGEYELGIIHQTVSGWNSNSSLKHQARQTGFVWKSIMSTAKILARKLCT